MAITIELEPQEIQPAYNEVTVVLDSTKKAEPKFQYVIGINVGGNYSSRLKVQSNPQGFGIANLSKHLESYVSSDVNFDSTDIKPIVNRNDMVFDDITDSINIGDTPSLGGMTEVNVNLDIEFKSSAFGIVARKSGEFSLIYGGGNLTSDLVVASGVASVITPLSIDNIYNVEIVYNNDILSMYIDGVLVDSDNSQSGAVINSANDMYLGKDLLNDSAIMNLNSFKIYSNSMREHLEIFKNIPNSFIDYDVTLSEEYVLTTDFTSVSDNSGFCQYNYLTDHNFSVDDFATVSNSTVVAYDGVQEVTSVPSSLAIVTTEVFSATATGKTVLSNWTVTNIPSATVFTGDKYIVNNVLKWRDVSNWNASNLNMGTIDRGKFLTNLPSTMITRLDDRFTFNYFDDSNGKDYLLKVITSNGETFYFDNNNIAVEFLSIGVGAYDISNYIPSTVIASDLEPVIKDATDSYTVELVDDNGFTISEVKTFELDRRCESGYKLMYLNSSGSFTTFNFELAYSKNVSANKTNYQKNYGSYNDTANTYGWTDSDRGATRLDTNINEVYTVNSNYVEESYGNLIEDLILSPEVYHIDNDVLRSIDIKTNSVKIKQRKVEKLINYSISFEYSSKNTVQR